MKTKFIAVGILALMCAGAAGQAQGDPPVYGGELIVKFKPQQDISTAISKALRDTGGPEAEAHYEEIRDYVSALAERAAVPLVMLRITSGGELILAIPRRVFLESLAGPIRSRRGVNTVEISLDPSESPMSQKDRLIVDFNPCAEASARLSRSTESESNDVARSIAATLLEPSARDFDGRRLPDNRLGISVDIQQVALELATRLQDWPEVEYAQPNFAVKIYDAPRTQ